MTAGESKAFQQNEAKTGTGLVYNIEDRPPVVESLFAALQHLLAIFVSICTPPLIIAGGLGCDDATKAYLVSMALFASGISTFIQCRRFGPIGWRRMRSGISGASSRRSSRARS